MDLFQVVEDIQITPDKYPMIGKIVHKDDNSVSCERTLTIESDRYLNDHRFNDTPFLPGVIGLELFTELGKIISPEETIHRFEEVEFKSAVRLKEDKPFTMNTKITSKEGSVDAVISSHRKKSSEDKPTTKLHFKAKVIFGSRKSERKDLPILNEMPLLTRNFIYQILPHGPSLQVVDELNSIEDEMIATCRIPKKQIFGWKVRNLATEPFSLEAAFQAIGLMDFILTGRVGLPSKIKQLTYFKSEEKPYFIVGKENPEKKGTYDFTILSKHGEVLLKAISFQMVEVNFGDTSSILEKLRSHRIRQLVPVNKKTWLEVIDKQLFLDKLSREPNFLSTFLSDDELVSVKELNENDQKKILLKFFAIKRALRLIFLSRKMWDFKLNKDGLGEYFAHYKHKKSYLTLAESSNYILAYASRKRRYGIYFYDKNEKLKIKKDELFSIEDLTWIESKKMELTEESLKYIFIAKKTVISYLGDKVDIGFKDITINSYTKEFISFLIDSSKIPNNQKRKIRKHKKEINVSLNQNKKYILSINL